MCEARAVGFGNLWCRHMPRVVGLWDERRSQAESHDCRVESFFARHAMARGCLCMTGVMRAWRGATLADRCGSAVTHEIKTLNKIFPVNAEWTCRDLWLPCKVKVPMGTPRARRQLLPREKA
eukprot:1063509-Prymnesium_polylepis.1